MRFGIVFLTVFLSFSFVPEIYPRGISDFTNTSPPQAPGQDTIQIKGGLYILAKDLIINIPRDTFYTSPAGEKQQLNNKKSKIFYDSVFHKFSRTKFSKALYDITFVPPVTTAIPDTINYLKSELPYENYEGAIIRRVLIYSLDPFGTSITDTLVRPKTSAGKFLNDIHIATKKAVIRKNLFFKPGQPVHARLLAENEKLLRESNAFDKASITIAPVDSCPDTVDIIVITKDVWSIGLGFGSVTMDKAVIRLYDANFLGFGNPLSNRMSFEVKRAPFFRYDGGSYVFRNIGGYFFDYSIGAMQDDDGNQNFFSILQRDFYSNSTKWAGGTGFNYFRDANIISDTQKIISYYNTGNLWGGRSFLFRKSKQQTRFVILESGYLKNYSSRPLVTPDSNKRYYNTIRVLTSLTISSNNYYLTHYITELGKTENIPYGFLFQGTFGPEFNDFYNRLFGGMLISAGNFFGNAGYFYGRLSVGGYFYHSAFQDAILKIQGIWLSPLLLTPDKQFKFRTYLWSDYRLGFNFLKNNDDHADLTTIMDINSGNESKNTEGVQSLTGSLTTIMFTPWEFYGFKFAIMTRLQAGMIAQKKEPIFLRPFYTGIKVGILVKNDNLVFPTLVFSVLCFPNPAPGSSMLYFTIDSDPYLNMPDFNVRPVNVESLQN